MIKLTIEETNLYEVIYEKYTTKFQGCQCYKDCTCHEDFTPSEYEGFAVIKKIGRRKTTYHKTLPEVVARIDQLQVSRKDISEKGV